MSGIGGGGSGCGNKGSSGSSSLDGRRRLAAAATAPPALCRSLLSLPSLACLRGRPHRTAGRRRRRLPSGRARMGRQRQHSRCLPRSCPRSPGGAGWLGLSRSSTAQTGCRHRQWAGTWGRSAVGRRSAAPRMELGQAAEVEGRAAGVAGQRQAVRRWAGGRPGPSGVAVVLAGRQYTDGVAYLQLSWRRTT